jgi:hypothetical protein
MPVRCFGWLTQQQDREEEKDACSEQHKQDFFRYPMIHFHDGSSVCFLLSVGSIG